MSRSLLTRILTAIGVLAVAVGIPVLLIVIAGWPLPSRLPDWTRLTTAIRQGDVPATVVINMLACGVWICWTQLTWTLIWETAAQLRHPYDPPAQHPAPLVPTRMHRTVARIVAFMLTATLTVTSTAKAQPLPARPAVASAVVTRSAPAVAAPVTAPLSPVAAVWVVTEGDTVWDIARIALGDGGRSGEILELNPGISPRDLRVGHHLTLPASATVPTDRVAAVATAPVESMLVYVPAGVVTVSPGDSLWALSESRLDTADGPWLIPTAPDIVDYLHQVIDTNTVPSGNPSLIHPGEQYTFPALGDPPPPQPTPTPPPEPEAPTPEATPKPATTLPPATSTSTTTPVPATTKPDPTVDSESASSAQTDRILAGITGATALATGLLLAYRRRRRLAGRNGAAGLHAVPSDRARQLVEGLVRAADMPLLRWANQQLAHLMANLDPRDVTGISLAAELSEHHGIELLWDTPQHRAPEGWTVTDDGWTWRRPYDPDAPFDAEPAIPPIPGLVTIGTRDGNQLLLNLEALGTLTLTGDMARAENLARAIVLEAGSGEELTGATCTVVGLAVDGDELFWRVDHADVPEALRLLDLYRVSYEQLLDETGLPGAFHTRLGDATDREIHIVVTDQANSAELDAIEILPNRGVAVVRVGTANEGPYIDVGPDRTATLWPLGVTFTAVGLPVATASEIAVLLDEADEPHANDDEPADVESTASSDEDPAVVDSELPAVDDDQADDWKLPEPEHLVRVLGAPRLDEAPSIGRLELSIIAFLACSGGSATPDQVIDAVWGGKAIGQGTFMNRLTKARNAAPGILPTRVNGDRYVKLAEDVTTDLHLLELALRRSLTAPSSRAIELLRAGLACVEGVPFDDPNFDWAHDRQHHAHASSIIERSALLLVDLALGVGDIDTARYGCRQGIRGLPLNEPLYRAHMLTEAAAGNPHGVRSAFGQLVRELTELDEDLTPAPESEALFRELAGGAHSPNEHSNWSNGR